MKVLILEDMPDQAYIVEYYLKKMGFKTVISYSGYEAIQLLTKVDIIVTDIQMPEMSGMEFIRFVREQSQIPIIVISAYADHHIMDEVFKTGANYYLVKPIDSADLKRIFRQWQS
jgi:CheY-like chemotaxis protein